MHSKMKNSWYSIEAKADGKSAKINIYEQIGKSFWSNDGIGAKEFVKDLDALDVDEIQLHINSPGGNAFEGNTIYNALKQHKAKVIVTVDGIAASIASVIVMAGDHVRMPENAMMMIHDPLGFVLGNASVMRKQADALDKIKQSIVAAYMTRSTEERSKIEDMMARETWLSAQEAVDIGFADEMMAGDKAQNFAFEMLSQFHNVPTQVLAMLGSKDNSSHEKEEPKMEITLETIKKDYPNIANALIEEGRIEGRNEGAQAERDRIKAVRAQSFPGHEALIDAMIEDGSTTGEQAAIRILQAEKQLRVTAKANLDADAMDLPHVPHDPPPHISTSKVDLSTEAGMKAAWEKDGKLREEFGNNFEFFTSYQKAENKGLFKILNKR